MYTNLKLLKNSIEILREYLVCQSLNKQVLFYLKSYKTRRTNNFYAFNNNNNNNIICTYTYKTKISKYFTTNTKIFLRKYFKQYKKTK